MTTAESSSTVVGKMASQDFSVERLGNIFVITLHRAPENRLNMTLCQGLQRAFHDIQRQLGPGSEGAVITRGCDDKYFSTVREFYTRIIN